MPFVEISKGSFSRPRFWLVSGKIVAVSQTSQRAVVTIEINHVYAGPAALSGRRFDARFSKEDSHDQFYGLSFLDTFAVGRRLISSVRWKNPNDDETKIDEGQLEYSRVYGIPLPTVLDGSIESLAVKKHAQAVEAVYRAPALRRDAMMMNYARAALPLTSNWAIASLANSRKPEDQEFLKQLATEKPRSIEQLSAIEYQLSRSLQNESWIGSQGRSGLLMRIATTPQAQDGGGEGLGALLFASKYLNFGAMTTARFTSILKAFIDNATVSQQFRLEAVARMSWLLNARNLPKTEAFTFWTSVLQQSRDTEVAEVCAQELLKNAPWSKEQNQQLETLSRGLKTQTFDAVTNQAEEKANAKVALEKAASTTRAQ